MKKIILFYILTFLVMQCTWQAENALPRYFRMVHIPKFGNETTEPRLVEYLSSKTVEEFELDGTLKVTERIVKADAILLCTIVKYKKVPMTYTDLGEIDISALTIRVDIKLRDIKSRKYLQDSYVRETIEFNFKSEPIETEEQAQQRIMDLLATRIRSKVIEGW